MEQRVQNLEELCELITKQVVEQNKNIIDVNQNLITEIRSLRSAFVKQDVSRSGQFGKVALQAVSVM